MEMEAEAEWSAHCTEELGAKIKRLNTYRVIGARSTFLTFFGITAMICFNSLRDYTLRTKPCRWKTLLSQVDHHATAGLPRHQPCHYLPHRPSLVVLGGLLRPHVGLVHFEECVGLRGLLSRHVVVCRGRDVVGLALPHETVVLQ